MYKNKSKTVHNCTMLRVISVSKKYNSVWRVCYHDYNDDDKVCLFTKRINPLLVWFYKGRFDKMPDICFECDPDQIGV